VTRYTLRPGTAADVEFILDVHARSMRPHVERQLGGWDAAAQRARILASTRPETHQIVEVGGTRVGCVWLREHPDELELVRLWLAPESQGSGLGGALVSDLCARADRERLPLRLRVLKVNPARRLYERAGFEVVQETETHFSMRRPPSGDGRTSMRVRIAGEFDPGSAAHAATRAGLAHAAERRVPPLEIGDSMRSRPWSHWVIFVCGVVIALQSLPHAFVGWPAFEPALLGAGVDPALVGGLSVGWYFGSVAMLVLGVVVLLAFRALRSGASLAWQVACAVGVGYLAFGLGAFLYRSNPHFLGFIAPGAALAAAALAARR
jgi:ribosomal protein S18 acetylase RimI-like enzyme